MGLDLASDAIPLRLWVGYSLGLQFGRCRELMEALVMQREVHLSSILCDGYDGSMNVGVLAKAIQDDIFHGRSQGSTLRLVRQFVMDLDRADDPAALFAEKPPHTGDPRWDALIAGVVEDYAFHHGLPSPSWTFAPDRFLAYWWFFTSFTSMRAHAIVHTPAALSARGVFLDRASLINV
ncbi:MAG: hypothetical protein ACP5O0_07120 [Acidimicrobiales bacterium]